MDISKYTSPLSLGWFDAIQKQGYGLVIVQAHPAGYGQETSLQQIAWMKAAGWVWHAYVYEYLADPTWTDGAIATLNLARARYGVLPDKLWLDVEDVTSAAQRMSPAQRVAAMWADFRKLDAWGQQAKISDPQTGLYTGRWWWDAYLPDLTTFADRALWDSNYDGTPNAGVFRPYGGWTSCAVKQWQGTSTLAGVGNVDLDVTAA